MGCCWSSVGVIMRILISILLVALATSIHAANVDYKAFRGTGGITVTTNPPPGGDGTVTIDGSGITATATNAIANAHGLGTNTSFYGAVTNNGTLRQDGHSTFSSATFTGAVTNTTSLRLQGSTTFEGAATFDLSAKFNFLPTNSIVRIGAGGTMTTSIIGSGLSLAADGTLSSTASGTPAGGSGSIQFTEGASLAGTNKLVYDRTNHTVKLIGNAPYIYVEDQTILVTNRYGASDINSLNSGLIIGTLGTNYWAFGAVANEHGALSPFNDDQVYLGLPDTRPAKSFLLDLNIDRNITIPWRPVVAATTIYASNAPNQLFNLGAATNITFAPLSGSDSSNSVPVRVSFTQDATGGHSVTFNGEVLDIDSNPNEITDVDFELKNGSTNAYVIVPVGRYHLSTLAGSGTSNTNFTALADGKRRQYLNAGLTNIAFTAIMRGQKSAHDSIVFVATNLTTDVCTMTLSSVTNKWIPVGGSLTAPFSITNALWLATETRGSNVFYAAQYMANPAP